ncbi:hypothetical protein SDC9_198164 [bioreactor metagenome]|uniref:Uncharacterized protein n=1 Tax=bioreactor metagenome TaxID=1076179 RepID=A0A645IGW8_9ZZZZ
MDAPEIVVEEDAKSVVGIPPDVLYIFMIAPSPGLDSFRRGTDIF